jgi:hypothetical protein
VDIVKEVEKLEDEKLAMVSYLLLKVKKEDWHGVADAAMDIREIVSKLDVLKKLP